MPSENNKIGSNIKSARESKGFTQEYMAAELKLNQSTYCRIESGIIQPSIGQAQQIAFILNVSFGKLTGDSGEQVQVL